MAEARSYSHAEIERYLQHKMSQQEMHEFEKTLMNDPFLADAIDGFSVSDPEVSEAHLAEIERFLSEGQQKAKVVPLPVKKAGWWKVAAITLVIVSAGVITYSVLNNNHTFYRDKDAVATSTPKASTIRKDTIQALDKPLAQIDIFPKKKLLNEKSGSPIIQKDAPEAPGINNLAEVAKATYKKSDSLITSLQAPVAANAEASPRVQMQLQRSSVQNEFKGKIVDKTGDPLPFASIKSENNSIHTVSDAKGNFSFKAADSVVEINVNSPGYATAKPTISNRAKNEIVLNEDSLSLAEIVVTTLSKKSKNATPNIRIDSSNTAAPVGGWKNFQQYLSKQQDFIKGIESYQNSDENFVLEFLVDKHGQPIDIKVPSELDKTTAEKTIEIISNGPRWNNKKKDKKVKVVIAF